MTLTPTHTETVIDEIRRERVRQETQEGWSTRHDDANHNNGELAQAAACYALGRTHVGGNTKQQVGLKGWIEATMSIEFWPWSASWWKPKTTRRNLVRAAALLVAEIERLDRANPSSPWYGGTP